MSPRENALNDWLNALFPHITYTLTPLAGDASFKRYYRLNTPHLSHIIMDAPPDKINMTPFINIAQQLTQHGVTTPAIHAVELTHGFMMLDDFGDELFLQAISSHPPDALYQVAIQTLSHLQMCPISQSSIPVFDQTFMLNELSLFQNWFLNQYLDMDVLPSEESLILETCQWLVDSIIKQAQVFVHRDFHSRNILLLPTPPSDPLKLGLIDFQDAVIGPITYDLVSLLKDCYVKWPEEKINQWLALFYNQHSMAIDRSLADFRRDFDLCGLQRHVRILGTFSRLHFRDQKSHYLSDLPLTFQYVMDCLKDYHQLGPFHEFMLNKVQPIFLSKTT